jgi:hypothetical protein
MPTYANTSVYRIYYETGWRSPLIYEGPRSLLSTFSISSLFVSPFLYSFFFLSASPSIIKVLYCLLCLLPAQGPKWLDYKCEHVRLLTWDLLFGIYFYIVLGPSQESKYIESWPNTTSVWAGWRRFDIPVDRSDRVHSLLHCTSWALGSSTCH